MSSQTLCRVLKLRIIHEKDITLFFPFDLESMESLINDDVVDIVQRSLEEDGVIKALKLQLRAHVLSVLKRNDSIPNASKALNSKSNSK